MPLKHKASKISETKSKTSKAKETKSKTSKAKEAKCKMSKIQKPKKVKAAKSGSKKTKADVTRRRVFKKKRNQPAIEMNQTDHDANVARLLPLENGD